MTAFLLCHSPDAYCFLAMDDLNEVYITHGNDTRPAPWRVVSIALTSHGFIEPPTDIFEFPDRGDMIDYLDNVSNEYWEAYENDTATSA